MLASFEHRFVFLCNPKTGTTALEHALDPHCEVRVGKTPNWKHLNYFAVKALFGETFDNAGCDYVTVVRDPLDTLHSWYRYRQRRALRQPGHPNRARFTGDISFEAFVGEWIAQSSERARVGISVNFCISPADEVAPALYWRYEDLDNLKAWQEDRIGAEVTIPFKNRSPEPPQSFDRDALLALPEIQNVYDAFRRIPTVTC
ncbi:MAG: hypothetical protein AAGG09_17600 [Pseudomonadota bacterium]